MQRRAKNCGNCVHWSGRGQVVDHFRCFKLSKLIYSRDLQAVAMNESVGPSPVFYTLPTFYCNLHEKKEN